MIGAGAAGSAAAAQLASCGVGYVAVVDGGTVALGDLAGQALYYTPDVGPSKADTLRRKLGLLNPEVQVESYPVDARRAERRGDRRGPRRRARLHARRRPRARGARRRGRSTVARGLAGEHSTAARPARAGAPDALGAAAAALEPPRR